MCFFCFQFNCFSQLTKIDHQFRSAEGDINNILPYLILENDTVDNPFKLQLQYQYYSYLHLFNKISKPFFLKKKLTDTMVSMIPAKEEILRKVDSQKIVMFNEEHHNPFHRLFLETLLKDLKEKGFAVLAVETLSWKDIKLNDRGYPISISGTYTVEPYFANLIRTALRLGYKVLPYESISMIDETIESREKNQAKNLTNIVNKEKGNVLVLAGYDHISEILINSNHGGQNEWMASILKKKLNIDPLTIDQTEMSVDNKLDIISIPIKDSKNYTVKELKYKYDISLVYPKDATYSHGELNKTKIEISISKKEIDKTQLIQFYVKEEYESHQNRAIPYEQFIPNSTKTDVYLDPKYRYVLIIRNKGYEVIYKHQIDDLKNSEFNFTNQE
jgi:hypothetical protein